jgi:hypothetical protein
LRATRARVIVKLNLTSTEPTDYAPSVLSSEFAELRVSQRSKQPKLGRMYDENLRFNCQPGRYFFHQWPQIFIHMTAGINADPEGAGRLF